MAMSQANVVTWPCDDCVLVVASHSNYCNTKPTHRFVYCGQMEYTEKNHGVIITRHDKDRR